MTLVDAIRFLSKQAATSAGDDDTREAAEKTGGVPVYSDLGGILVVHADGEVLHFDPEQHTVRPVNDEGWRKVALGTAARRFPELRALLPPRPESAIVCAACEGRGSILGGVGCGLCWGLGWIDAPPPQQ